MQKFSLDSQIAEVRREIDMRKRVYPGWVQGRRLSQGKADMQMDLMYSVLATLEWLKNNEAAVRAAVGGGDEI